LKQLLHDQIVYEKARHGISSNDIGIDTIAIQESDLIDKVLGLECNL
jgi:hypothetical protein